MTVASSTHHGFHERLAWSRDTAFAGIEEILRNRFPGCIAVERAQEVDDRKGTDYWVRRAKSPDLSIDVKIRTKDLAPQGSDDLALETWSVIDKKPGWTRDLNKRTDYILWFWSDTGRFCLVPFPILCDVFSMYWLTWRETYGPHVQNSGSWQSECIFVPRMVVLEKIMAWMNGNYDSPPQLVEDRPQDLSFIHRAASSATQVASVKFP